MIVNFSVTGINPYKCKPINKHSQRILPAFNLPVDCLLTFPNATCTVQYITRRHANRALQLVRIRQRESVVTPNRT